MANGYLQEGRILFHDAGAFRIAQRGEDEGSFLFRLDRLNNELCALPYHPHLSSMPDRIHVELFGQEIGEMCLMLVKTVAIIKGQPWLV